MKRLLLSLTLALFAFSGSVNAQETRFNEEALMKKLAKLEADSKDAKKGAKAATWLELGKVYENAATGLTNGLYVGLDSMTTELVFPKPERGVETINGVTYSKWSYPDFDVYLENGVVSFWSVKKVVVEDALAKAAAAYNKAYELDNSTAEKVAEGLGKVVDGYKQDASNFFELRQFIPTAEAFAAAFDLQRHPTLNRMDTASCYYAGYIYTLGKKFDLGEKYLKEAIDYGYESEGDAYYYQFHSYYGQKKMDEAKQILLAGVTKYPKNSQILEMLISLYAETGEDPHDIIPYVQKGIENDPNNPELWSGLGRVYDKLGDNQKALEAFGKAVGLTPDDFNANFNYALMVVRSADNMTTEFNGKSFTSREERDAEMAKLNAEYAKALAPLEKAHSINPEEPITVELLKSLYFRLRDESPEMMDNFNKYNELFKSMQQ